MIPAHQCLQATHLSRHQVHDGLILQLQFVPLDGVPEVGEQVQPLHDFLMHVRLEMLDACLAALLREVHRKVCIPQ